MSSNFRTHLLSLSLLVGVAAPWVATASAPISNVGSGSIDDRVTTLERISNGQGQLLNQLQQQVSDNQNDIANLRGQIQDNQYQLKQITDRQNQILQQIASMQSSGSAPAPAASASAGAAASDEGASSQPSENSSSAMTGNPDTDYNAAVSLALEKKQYDQAISAFQAFIKQYPTSTYLPNANYWLGQLYYNKGKKDDAAYYYAVVVKNYPKSPKSPDAMYKVGIIMQEKGQSEKAKAVFQQVVKQYPNSESGKLAQKRLSAK